VINRDFTGKRRQQITVIGDADASPGAFMFAEKLGTELAMSGYIVVTGGRGGIMEAVCKGSYNAGGITVGILPTSSFEAANQYCTVIIPTGLGHARNIITALSCIAIVSIGGGAGTLSEICFGWIYQKPIFVFDQFDGWSEKVAERQLDNKYPTKIERCSTIEELIIKLKSLPYS